MVSRTLCAVGIGIIASFAFVQSVKIPFGNVGVELGDYRLRNGEPFVSLYEHENYRGNLFRQRVKKDCTNIPKEYDNWASSIMLHDRCVTLCDESDCLGNCKNLYPNQKGVKRLVTVELNDKATSLKFCYQYG